MALYLVQHGKSLPEDLDHERGLSPEGIADVTRIAEVAKGYGIRPGTILHSGKKRARQTAEIFAAFLLSGTEVVYTSGIDPLDDATELARKIRTEDNWMLVGHLPFMERLAGFLITGSAQKLVFKFQNGGIVCLDKDDNSPWWFIKWALMPRIG
ncbi:MAG: phosphohistidine phosphatase SixA [Syntrophobacter sp.]